MASLYKFALVRESGMQDAEARTVLKNKVHDKKPCAFRALKMDCGHTSGSVCVPPWTQLLAKLRQKGDCDSLGALSTCLELIFRYLIKLSAPLLIDTRRLASRSVS